ncbi:exported hypothetical protein [Thiomonas sp. X19]|nr:exported hypothetical protein [Thiomonas sp. X19]
MALVGALVIGLSFGQAEAAAETAVDAQIGVPGGVVAEQWAINSRFTARTGIHGSDDRGIIKSRKVKPLLGRHPLEAIFQRASAVFNNRFDLNGQPRQQIYQTNGMANILAADGSINHKVSFSKNVPYSGFGWGKQGPTEGWQFRSDVGVAYQGQINVTAAGRAFRANLDFRPDSDRTGAAPEHIKWISLASGTPDRYGLRFLKPTCHLFYSFLWIGHHEYQLFKNKRLGHLFCSDRIRLRWRGGKHGRCGRHDDICSNRRCAMQTHSQ